MFHQPGLPGMGGSEASSSPGRPLEEFPDPFSAARNRVEFLEATTKVGGTAHPHQHHHHQGSSNSSPSILGYGGAKSMDKTYERRQSSGGHIYVPDHYGTRQMRVFPPPLTSLARTISSPFPNQMPLVPLQPIRSHGRFVLQEQKVPRQLMFEPIRTSGRLVLQLKWQYEEEEKHILEPMSPSSREYRHPSDSSGSRRQQESLDEQDDDEKSSVTARKGKPGGTEQQTGIKLAAEKHEKPVVLMVVQQQQEITASSILVKPLEPGKCCAPAEVFPSASAAEEPKNLACDIAAAAPA